MTTERPAFWRWAGTVKGGPDDPVQAVAKARRRRGRIAALLQEAEDGEIVVILPWNRIFELWPNPLDSLADASIAALATFDRKLGRRAKDLGVTSYR